MKANETLRPNPCDGNQWVQKFFACRDAFTNVPRASIRAICGRPIAERAACRHDRAPRHRRRAPRAHDGWPPGGFRIGCAGGTIGSASCEMGQGRARTRFLRIARLRNPNPLLYRLLRLPALVRRSEHQETAMTEAPKSESGFQYSITNLKPAEPQLKIALTFPNG